jgi:cell division protein FtsZ
MVFVTTGLGGGTGTGAAPIIASLASEMGALTVAVVTKPFAFEGRRRMAQAERGLAELIDSIDTTIVIPNEKLLAVAQNAGFFESFRIADDILRQAVQGISDIITIPGIINRDFADVKTIMAGMGYAVMGTAVAKGDRRASEAAQAAISSPLLEAGAIDGARGILINITGSSSLKLAEVNEASTIIQSAAHEDANIIFGAVHSERMEDSIKVTVIATGFRSDQTQRKDRVVSSVQQAISSARTASAYQMQTGSPDHAALARTGTEQATPDRAAYARAGAERGGNGGATTYSSAATQVAAPAQVAAPPRVAAPARETPNLASMTEAIRGAVEHDDLDVPAFIRKRGEVN